VLAALPAVAAPTPIGVSLAADLPRSQARPRNYLAVLHREPLLELLGLSESEPRPRQDQATDLVKRIIFLVERAHAAKGREASHFKDGYSYLTSALNGAHEFNGCGSTSIIVRDCLRAAGIPARNVGLVVTGEQIGDSPVVRLSQGHTTNELYIQGRWRWFDAYFQCAYARDTLDGRHLNTWELIDYLGDPARRGRLVFGVYDPARRTIDDRPIDAATELRHTMERLFTADKELVFSE
jgi:hypothetical protein